MEERPVEDERSDENSQGETPRFREGERLGEAFGGDPITVVDTQASILKGDQASVGVDLDVLPRTGKDKIFPQGKTNNYVSKKCYWGNARDRIQFRIRHHCQQATRAL